MMTRSPLGQLRLWAPYSGVRDDFTSTTSSSVCAAAKAVISLGSTLYICDILIALINISIVSSPVSTQSHLSANCVFFTAHHPVTIILAVSTTTEALLPLSIIIILLSRLFSLYYHCHCSTTTASDINGDFTKLLIVSGYCYKYRVFYHEHPSLRLQARRLSDDDSSPAERDTRLH